MANKKIEQRAIKLVLAHADEYKAAGRSVLDCRTDDWVWALPTATNKSQQYVVWLSNVERPIFIGARKKVLEDWPYYCCFARHRHLKTVILGNDFQVKYAKHTIKDGYSPAEFKYGLNSFHQKVNFWTLQKDIYVRSYITRCLEKIPDENRQKKILKAWCDFWSYICDYFPGFPHDEAGKPAMLVLCNPLTQDYHKAAEILKIYVSLNGCTRFCSGELSQVITLFNQLNLPILKFFEWEINLIQEHKIAVNYFQYLDYIRMRDQVRFVYDVRKLPLFPALQISPYKITRLHDFCVKIYNSHWEELHQAELKEKEKQYSENILPIVKCFEMEGNEFSIIAAPNLASLLEEGRALHHCVGSYVDSVKDGSEYILYMRKNSEIDKPYLTVDITPDKNCRQIHGVNNSNVKPNSPEAQFIKEWAEKFGIDVKKINGICCHL